MPPHTPRSTQNRTGNALTPSFSFGLGLLPSIRFTSPRNINILSSISPHRFFNRFTKGADEHIHPDALPEHVQQQPAAKDGSPGLFEFDQAKENQFMEFSLLQSAKMDDNNSDLICTSESVEMWSLANENQTAMNLTSINEDTNDKDMFLSPEELFLEKPSQMPAVLPKLESSPIEDDTPLSVTRTPTKRRKLSSNSDSPCKLLATQIADLDSPQRLKGSTPKSTSSSTKLWTAELDDALLRCYEKYTRYRQTHSPNSAVFKYTTQNKILSRMLQNKTGVARTAKQITARLVRLKNSPGPKPAKQPESSKNILSSPPEIVVTDALHSLRNALADLVSIEQILIAFNYKHTIPREHQFTTLNQKAGNPPLNLPVSGARKLLPYENHKFAAEFDTISPKLLAQNVLIHNVHCEINFKTQDALTSTPASPFTDPKSLSMDNGSFLSYTSIKVPGSKLTDGFLSWTSSITVYKGNDKVLLKTKERVNGYKNETGNFEFDLPFLNNFWAGYLTFLTNGSNSFEDIKGIVILQVIHEGNDENSGRIHGYFIYRFDLAAFNGGYSSVSSIKLKELSLTGDSEDLEDDNATVLAASSPLKPSPPRRALSVRTDVANACTVAGPLTAPTMNAAILHKFNPNYGASMEAPQERPFIHQSNSTNSIYVDASSTTPVIGSARDLQDMTPPLSSMGQPSAGQIIPQMRNDQGPAQSCPPNPQTFVNSNMTAAPMVNPYAQFNAPAQFQQPDGSKMAGMMPMGSMPQQQVPVHMMAATMPPQQQWAVNGMDVNRFSQPSVSSAPPTQLQFFPGSQESTSSRDQGKVGNTITFGPILEYDPSKDLKSHTKRAKSNVNFHKFPLNPQIMYKPKRK